VANCSWARRKALISGQTAADGKRKIINDNNNNNTTIQLGSIDESTPGQTGLKSAGGYGVHRE